MKQRLISFENNTNVIINGELLIIDGMFNLKFDLSGDVESITWPLPIDHLKRRDELWKESCFEFFLRNGNGPEYLEFNFWGTGEFNAYEFKNYREMVGPLKNFDKFEYDFKKSKSSVSFSVKFQSPLGIKDLYGSMTMVLKRKDGSDDYFAWAHKNSRPDFHFAESFIPLGS